MRDEDIQKAKEIFLNYDCSHFRIYKDGAYEEYKRFKVSKDQERIWLNKYQDELISKIQVENVSCPSFSDLWATIENTAFNDIDPNKFSYLLKAVYKKMSNADSFTKLLIAESIRRIVEALIDNMVVDDNITDAKVTVNVEAKKMALSILENIINNPITVYKHYKESNNLPELTLITLNKEEIVKRAKEEIKEWKKIKQVVGDSC
jgi:hypothetical protein